VNCGNRPDSIPVPRVSVGSHTELGRWGVELGGENSCSGILDRLRAWLPRTRSVLMDHETLLAHRDRWVSEDRPATSTLTRLTADERGLYVALVEGRLGDRVRLEQEVIDWLWVEQRLSVAISSDGGCPP
jgi:hypothetical protein